jgi:hypothetical protein
MERAISIRLDGDAQNALRALTRTGRTQSEEELASDVGVSPGGILAEKPQR